MVGDVSLQKSNPLFANNTMINSQVVIVKVFCVVTMTLTSSVKSVVLYFKKFPQGLPVTFVH